MQIGSALACARKDNANKLIMDTMGGGGTRAPAEDITMCTCAAAINYLETGTNSIMRKDLQCTPLAIRLECAAN